MVVNISLLACYVVVNISLLIAVKTLSCSSRDNKMNYYHPIHLHVGTLTQEAMKNSAPVDLNASKGTRVTSLPSVESKGRTHPFSVTFQETCTFQNNFVSE